MALARDAILAALVAAAGAAALVLLPDPQVQSPPVEPDPPTDPVDPGPEPDPEPDPDPDPDPDPEPDPEPEPVVDSAGAMFAFDAPGALTEFDFRDGESTPGFSGEGWAGSPAYPDTYVFAPGIGWPLAGDGFANSQVYRPGGMLGGDECDSLNYSYPWQDNFCETRSRTNGFCTSDRGHQGQDIRPASCPRQSGGGDMAVAVADGYISHIGSISVKLRDEAGRTYWYLHLKHWESCDLSLLSTPEQCNSSQLASVCTASALAVEQGDEMQAGDPIGEVSDWFGVEWRGGACREALTTDHLHFEIWDTISPDGAPTSSAVRVPPYSSLVLAYLRRLGAEPAQTPAWDSADNPAP